MLPKAVWGVKLGHRPDVRCKTAFPPKAEVHRRSCYVARVPISPDWCVAASGRLLALGRRYESEHRFAMLRARSRHRPPINNRSFALTLAPPPKTFTSRPCRTLLLTGGTNAHRRYQAGCRMKFRSSLRTGKIPLCSRGSEVSLSSR